MLVIMIMIVLIKSRRKLHNYMNADADRKAFSMDSSGFTAVFQRFSVTSGCGTPYTRMYGMPSKR